MSAKLSNNSFASRRLLLALCTVPVLSFGLVACGGSTVDSADVTSSSATQASQSASETASSKESSKPKSESARDIRDPAASRASAAPSGQMPLSKKDEAYLDDLIAAKIDVAGVEDQLIGAGRSHCSEGAKNGEENVMVNAIAGQLLAQQRASGTAPAVSSAIAKAAQKAYC